MKKIISALVLAMIAVGSLFMVGCTTENMRMLSEQSGTYATILWISIDNPSPDAKTFVCEIASYISDKSKDMEVDQNFSHVMYSDICDLIDNNDKIDINIKPLVKAGSLALLNGIDLFFIANPKWAKTTSDITVIAGSFCKGAISALNLPVSDSRIKQAMSSAKNRQKLLK